MANVTVNISLPVELKMAADELIKAGHYASFSDFVRTAIRQLIEQYKRENLEIFLDRKRPKY